MASLLDDWARQESGVPDASPRGDADYGLDAVAGPSEGDGGADMFTLDVVEREVTRGRGAVTAVAAGGDAVVVVTARGYLLRYDVAAGGAPTEIELSRAPDAAATAVWLDASGTHAVVALDAGGGRRETHYCHARWKRSRALAGAGGGGVTAAAWDAAAVTDTTTGEILLGTDAGDLLTLTFDERDKRERGSAALYTLRDPGGGGGRPRVTGAAQARALGGRRVALVATPTRLHVFAGPPTAGASLVAVFAAYPADGADLVNAWVPTPPAPSAPPPPLDGGAGALAVLPSPAGGLDVTWLAPAGLATARLPATADGPPPPPGRDADLLADRALAPLPAAALGPAAPPAVRAMVATRYHALVADGGRVLAFNRVSGGLVQALTPSARGGVSAAASPPPLLPRRALAVDPTSTAVYVAAGDALVEAAASGDEGRDMWRVFASRGDFAAAAAAATTRAARDAVALAEADTAFAAGDRGRAAALYGRTLAADPPFEETALRFVDARDDGALAALLSARIAALPRSDRAQAAVLAAWLLELKLDAVNRAALGGGEEGAGGGGGAATPAADDAADDLRSTLERHADALDVGVAVGLLAAYGRADDLLHYARLRGDVEAVLEHLTAARGGDGCGGGAPDPAAAAAALRAAAAAPDVAVRFAPALFAAAPDAAVDAWLAAGLDSGRLLPALARARGADAPRGARAAALRYARAVADAGGGEAALHNLAVALLAEEAKERKGAEGEPAAAADDDDDGGPEAPLLAYLAAARTPTGAPRYDAALALADAAAGGCSRAVVALLADAGAPEDAVEAALAFDPALAARVAAAPDADPDTRRRLALAVVRHIVAAAPADDPSSAVDAADAFLRSDAGACLRLEDVLPLFPAATTVGAFKAAVVRTLDAADARAAALRASAAAAAAAADAARADLAALGRRAGSVGGAEPCARCGRAVGGPPPASAGPAGGGLPPVYLFPTGAAYHGACTAAAAAAALPPPAAAALRARVAAVAGGGAAAASVAALDAELGAEDPACGERAVRSLDVPLLGEGDAGEVRAWEVSV